MLEPKMALNISSAKVTGISKRALKYRCSITKIPEKLKVNSENFYILPCSNDFSLIGTYTEFFDIIGTLYNKGKPKGGHAHTYQATMRVLHQSLTDISSMEKNKLSNLVYWCNRYEHTSR